jgi:hypothetical protein
MRIGHKKTDSLLFGKRIRNKRMSLFLRSDKGFKVSTAEALNIHDTLPVGTYTVGFNACSGEYYLETIDSFESKGKLYGDTNRSNTEQILRTFSNREVSTGVLLTGEKGSGKKMLAKSISILAAAAEGIPTIVVNQDWCGDDLQFIRAND